MDARPPLPSPERGSGGAALAVVQQIPQERARAKHEPHEERVQTVRSRRHRPREEHERIAWEHEADKESRLKKERGEEQRVDERPLRHRRVKESLRHVLL